MNILSDPCCIGAIVVLVIYGLVRFASVVVREYRRGSDKSLTADDRN